MTISKNEKSKNIYGMNETRNMLRNKLRDIKKTTRKVLRIIMNETRFVFRIIINETRNKEQKNTGNKENNITNETKTQSIK